MSVIIMQVISCNGPNCDKSVAFEIAGNGQPTEEGVKVLAATEWFKGLRQVLTADKRNFSYCSDTCEVEQISTGAHNPPEEKKIIAIDQGKHNLAMAQAKRHAEAARQSNQALKSGAPINIQE